MLITICWDAAILVAAPCAPQTMSLSLLECTETDFSTNVQAAGRLQFMY